MNQHLIIGKIIGAHGVRGEVKVFPITDNVRRFNKLKKVFFCKEDGTIIKEVDIKTSRVDRGNALIVFEGINDRDAAEKLRGIHLAVSREDAVKLPKDTFFIADMIGLEVIDDDLGTLGKISEVFETGANFVITVKRSGKKDLLIPFLKVVCYETDIEAGTMKVRLPEGLYEIYEG